MHIYANMCISMIITPIILYVVTYFDIWHRPCARRFNTKTQMNAFISDLIEQKRQFQVDEIPTRLVLITN